MREGRAETRGKPGSSSHTRIDPGKGKLAVATADQQRGFGTAVGCEQRNDFRLHTSSEASRVPGLATNKNQ